MHAHSNATCRMGLKSRPKFTKLRFKQPYKGEISAQKLRTSNIGFAGAAGDKKYVDVASTTYANDTTGQITHWSIVTRGVAVTQRLGVSCRLTSIQMRGTIDLNANFVTTKYANYLVWDNQPDKALPVITDIFDTANANSMINRDNASRFRILRKWVGIMECIIGTGVNNSKISIDEFIKFPKDLIVRCTAGDATGVIGNTVSGALYFVTLGTTAAGQSAATTTVSARVNFSE